MIPKVIKGETHTVVYNNSSTIRENRQQDLIYQLDYGGVFLQSYQELKNFTEIIKKGGKYEGCSLGIKIKGFMFYKKKKLDIFSLKDISKSFNKPKSLKVTHYDEVVEFCKLARSSELTLRSAYRDQLASQKLIHVTQLIFYVKDGHSSKKIVEGRLSFVRVNLGNKKKRSKFPNDQEDLQNYIMTSVVSK